MNTSLVERATKQSLTEEEFTAEPAGQKVKGTVHPKRKRGEGVFSNKFWIFGTSGDFKSVGRAVWSHFSLFFQSPAALVVQENDATLFYYYVPSACR